MLNIISTIGSLEILQICINNFYIDRIKSYKIVYLASIIILDMESSIEEKLFNIYYHTRHQTLY